MDYPFQDWLYLQFVELPKQEPIHMKALKSQTLGAIVHVQLWNKDIDWTIVFFE